MSDRSLPLSAELRHDEVCGRFEAALKADPPPQLEDYLGQVPEPERSSLFRELLALEVLYRRRKDQRPTVEDYRQRFAEYVDVARAVLQETDSPEPIAVGGEPGLHYQVTASWQPGLHDEVTTAPGGLALPAEETRQAGTLLTEFIGKYRVVEWLGGGGQGDIFRAVHPSLPGRDLVIKWASQALPAAHREKLVDEGQVLAKLDDPGLVRIYDVDTHAGRPFVVMEYVPGLSLHAQLKQGPHSPRRAAALAAEVAGILARVHGQGVWHRDLKPANILIDGAGRPRLVDFGLALMTPSWGEPGQPPSGVSGTFQYMAPEQAAGEVERIGPWTDVFGLGGGSMRC